MSARAFRRAAAKLERVRIRQAQREMRSLLRRHPAGITYTAELKPLAEAVADPRIGASVAELVLLSAATVIGSDSRRECFGCCQRWTLDRVIAGVLFVDFLGAGSGLVAGVCDACCAPARARGMVLAGLARDLGADPASIRLVHEGSRA